MDFAVTAFPPPDGVLWSTSRASGDAGQAKGAKLTRPPPPPLDIIVEISYTFYDLFVMMRSTRRPARRQRGAVCTCVRVVSNGTTIANSWMRRTPPMKSIALVAVVGRPRQSVNP